MNLKKENVINKCKDYNYELLEYNYTGYKSKIYLKCKTDNYIWSTTYYKFITKNRKCPKCVGSARISQEEAELKVKNMCILKNYKYEAFEYIGNRKTRIYLTCNIDNYSWNMNYSNFVNNVAGCPKCGGTLKITQEEAENTIKQTYYELVEPFIYKNYETLIHLRCNKCNNTWFVTYHNLITNRGCPKCKVFKLEKEVEDYLIENNISYIHQYKPEFLKNKYQQSLDFYLCDYNIAIECQGLQHFKPVDFAGKGEDWSKNSFEKILERDERKFYICKENNIKIYYYSNRMINNYLDNIYLKISDIFEDILNKNILK